MAFAGLRGTGDWGTDERPKHFRNSILWLEPNGQAPLTALMSKMDKETVDDPEFSWWEEVLDTTRVVVGGAGLSATSTDTTVVSGGLQLVPGDVLQVEKVENQAAYDNELVVVSSVTSDTAIVLKRAQAGSSGAAIAAGAGMTRIGSAWEEGTRSPNVSLRNPTKFTNYVQIFKTAVEETNTAGRTKTRTGNSWKNDIKRKMFDHSNALEWAAFWGKPHEVAQGPTKGKPIRFTGGLRWFLSSNVKVYTTTPTEDSFIDFALPMFNYSSGGAGTERIMFCGNGFWTSLNKLARNAPSSRINHQGTIKLYGMELEKWVFPFGTVAVKTHPLFNTHPKWNYSAFFLHGKGLKWRPLRDTKFMDNIQENDEDTKKAQWLTEGGYEFHHERTMGYVGNFVV